MKSFISAVKTPLLLGLSVFTLCATHSYADNHDPEKVIEELFWGQLYADGGKTFYCNKEFSKKTPLIAESYVYSTSWIKDYLQCGTDRQCKRESPEYIRILSDLHNIVPADAYFNFKRKTSSFGIADETIEANECGIKKAFQIIEPPDSIKGDIARIIVFMHTTYDLPLKQTASELLRWNEIDPPSAEEIARNEKIKALQGNSNIYIDQPKLMENLRD